MIEGLATSGGPASVMLIASLVGGFGIESSVIAEIQLIASMFGGMAAEVGLPAKLYGAGSPGRHPFDGQHLSYNQFCRSNGNRTVLQHQGRYCRHFGSSRILSGLFSHYGVCWPNYLLDAASPSFTYFLNEDGGPVVPAAIAHHL